MAYLLVPLQVSTTDATIWVGAVGEPPRELALRAAPGQSDVRLPDAWDHWQARPGGPSLAVQRVSIGSLRPRTRYAVDVRSGDEVLASGSLTTLPDRLPPLGEPPFTVMLGSCFYARADAMGSVGNVFFHVPGALQPDVKFLCGDQVYLDAPWQHFLLRTHSEEEMRTEFLETYLRGWSHAGDSMGFSELLRHGATYFSSDDHDLWNNAPNASVIARDTWTHGGRERWHRTANELFQRFQSPTLVDRFDVGALSFLVLD